MRFVFMGTPQYAAIILQRLIISGKIPSLVVTQPDRLAGRHRQLAPPPVKAVAQAANLPIIQPEKITAEVRERLILEQSDLFVISAFGKILRPTVLSIPRLGCLNTHASLLPAYRGAAPINWALIKGESQTGVTIMLLDEGIDTGPILARRALPIDPADDAHTLLFKLAEAGGALLLETMERYVAGEIKPMPQPTEGASYAPMLTKEDGLIDWSRPARDIVNRVRGANPWPGAYTFWQGKTIKILAAETAQAAGTPGTVVVAKKEFIVAARDSAVRLLQLQSEGKKVLDAESFLNGVRIQVGDHLGAS